MDNKILYSRHHTGLPGLLSDIRKRSHKSSPLNRAKQNIHNLFQSEIREQEENIKLISDRIRLLQGEKDIAYRNKNSHLEDNKELIVDLKDAISEHKRLVTAYKGVLALFNNFWDVATDYANEIIRFNNRKGRYREVYDKSKDIWDVAERKLGIRDNIEKKVGQDTYKNEYLNWLATQIEEALNQGSSKPSDDYQQLKELDAALQQERLQREALKDLLVRASEVYEAAIDAGIKTYLQKQSSTSLCITDKVVNIFDAIEQRDFNGFLCSFQDGVDLSMCNKQGFTPLTYAVHHGNVAMVKFFLDHNADCAGLDKRGYNALHTAIQVGSKHICEMLLQHNSMLFTIPARLPNGQTQSIQDLLNQSNFTQWAQQALV